MAWQRWALWPTTLVAFGGLTLLDKQVAPQEKVISVSGEKLHNEVQTNLVSVRGTLISTERNLEGSTTIEIQSDDGYNVRILIPPSTAFQRPLRGQRLEVTGRQSGRDMITLNHRWDLKIIDPKSYYPFVQNPFEMPANARFQTKAHISILSYLDSGVTVAELEINDTFVTTATFGRSLTPTNGTHLIWGYFNSDRTMTVEGIGE